MKGAKIILTMLVLGIVMTTSSGLRSQTPPENELPQQRWKLGLCQDFIPGSGVIYGSGCLTPDDNGACSRHQYCKYPF